MWYSSQKEENYNIITEFTKYLTDLMQKNICHNAKSQYHYLKKINFYMY